MGFHPVGKIYHFRRDQSRHPINAAIYTLHPEDRAFAWQQALQRAARLQTVELAQSA
jgi:hypothetical protein